jgi:hypothetical protein
MPEDFWARALRKERLTIDDQNNDDVPELGSEPNAKLLGMRNALLRRARAKVPTLNITAYDPTGDDMADAVELSREIKDLQAFVDRPTPGLSDDAVDETSPEYLDH